MDQQRQLEEALSWRLVTELWRRFPDRYCLIETHSGGGQCDCLSLIEFAAESWSNWVERMLGDPRRFLDEVCDAIGIEAPAKYKRVAGDH